jgi:hypothetical protein
MAKSEHVGLAHEDENLSRLAHIGFLPVRVGDFGGKCLGDAIGRPIAVFLEKGDVIFRESIMGDGLFANVVLFFATSRIVSFVE